MCGICGYAGFERDANMLARMTGVIEHRGPDDDGFLLEDQVGLGMRRLSIIDVAGGQQPITNEDATVSIVFNGEIYNYKSLADDLIRRGHQFRTHCDTETILHLYEEYGVDCLQHLRGMFTFAIYDKNQQRLFIARDRLGVKPLYYWERNGKLVFASEIKSILECPDVPREPNMAAVDAYLGLRYVPGPETMFAGIRKLPAAHWMIWSHGQSRMERYWAPELHSGPYQPDEYYRERFAELFTESIRLRLMSEVPLGSFLSGGLDSSAIVATMSGLMNRPVKTFSVGFNWQGDELPAAREVAQKLGCDHHEIVCRPEDMALLPKIVWHLDEPVGDAIVVPMYLLSQLARQHVTVVLTGEGADETMAGYFPHKVMYWARQYARRTPRAIQNLLVKPLVGRLPTQFLNLAFDYPAKLGERGRRKLLDYLTLLQAQQPKAEYQFLISLFDKRDKDGLYTEELRPHENMLPMHNGLHLNDGSAPYLDQLLALQYAHWLPDDILMKQDKMTMANSIEGRVPFLDHVLVEFLMQTPPHLKLHRTTNKALLRDYLRKVLPQDVARRPKKPFYIPLDKYLGKGSFGEIVDTCLSEESVRRRGYFTWEGVRKLREAVAGGDFLFGKQVLSLVMLELWHRIFIDRESGWVS
ncbi:MAG: asparagine synthase (glutamine-hydrolyzing) [Acidobacteria bacterium]|nr:asparagine synthase (glutamine-hydrolyzing) [Acidobacteriota bacterium]